MAHIIHQFLIFGFIYNCNNLIPLLHIVGTVGFIHRRAAVQVLNDEPAEWFVRPGDDADAALEVVVTD